QRPLGGPASGQASGTPSCSGAYSESFEDDPEDKGGDDGEGGDPIVEHLLGGGGGGGGGSSTSSEGGGKGSTERAPPDSARGSSRAKADEGQVLSSVSEVCSEAFSVQDEGSVAGSFSVWQDYVEDALSPPGNVGPGDAADTAREEADALSWQALIFDASPPSVRNGGTVDSALAGAAAADDAEFSPGVRGSGRGEAGDGSGAILTSPAGDALTAYASDEEGEMTKAREERPEETGDGIPGGRRSEKTPGEEEPGGGGSCDDGGVHGIGDGLLLPSPAESLDAGSVKSFLIGDDRAAGDDEKGPSATLSDEGEFRTAEALGDGDGSSCDEIPDLSEPMLGGAAPTAAGGSSFAIVEEPGDPAAEADTSSVKGVVAPANVVPPAYVDDRSGSDVGGEQTQLLDDGYSFIEDARPSDEARRQGEGGDDGGNSGEGEAWGVEADQPGSTSLPLSTPAIEEAGPLLGLVGREEGAEREPDAGEEEAPQEENGLVDVGDATGSSSGAPGGCKGGSDGDMGARFSSGPHDFEEDVVEPSAKEEAPRGENGLVDVGDATGSFHGTQKGGRGSDDGDIGASTWSEGYDFEEDAVVVGPSSEADAPREDDGSLLPSGATAAAGDAGERDGVSEAGGEYRAWAAGKPAHPSWEDGTVAVEGKVAIQEVDELREEEAARLEASSPYPLAGVGNAGLDACDYVEDAVGASAGGNSEVAPRLQRADEQSTPTSSLSGHSCPVSGVHEVDEGREAAGEAGDENVAVVAPAVLDSSQESFGFVDAGDDDDAEAPPQRQPLPESPDAPPARPVHDSAPPSPAEGADPAADCTGGGREPAAAPEPSTSSVAAEEERIFSAPEDGSEGDGESRRAGGAGAVVSDDGGGGDEPDVDPAATSVAVASGAAVDEAPHRDAEAVATFSSGPPSPATSDHEAPAAGVPEAAACAAASGEEGAMAVARANLRADNDRRVDSITDRLLASLLERELGAARPPKAAAASGAKESASQPPMAAGANAGPASTGVDDGDREDGADVDATRDEESRKRPSAVIWDELTSGDDKTGCNEQGLRGEKELRAELQAAVMASATGGDWGTAAVTETYRSEEGMLMVVRDNGSDDSGGSDGSLGHSPQQQQQQQQQYRYGESSRAEEEEEERALVRRTPPPGSNASGGGGDLPAAGAENVDDAEEDEYYFPPVVLTRPKKPWMALATQPLPANGEGNREEREQDPHTPSTISAAAATPGEVSFGVRSGGGGNGDASLGFRAGGEDAIFEGGEAGLPSPSAAAQVSLGVRSGGGVDGGGWGEDAGVGETLEYTGGGRSSEAEGEDVEEGDQFMVEGEELGWPEYPWWPVLADAIETALRSMTLDELNHRMAMHYLPDEPFIEELEGRDGMEFPPPPEAPLEDEAVIPPRVIDDLLDAPDDEILGSLTEMGGMPHPDRDALDSARWMAYDAANEYLAEQRSMRAPRRPHDPPAPSGKLLHRIEGFRHFRSVIWCT
ncbi:unnamed protein product, partial [Hapterophycus canaliculatus]